MTIYETLKDRITEAQLEVYEANGGSASDGELADAVLAALGLDADTLAVVADAGYSAEFIGNLLRSKLLTTDQS